MSSLSHKNARYDDIIDLDVFHKTLDDIAQKHPGNNQTARDQVLALIRDVNETGRTKAHSMLKEDGGGVLCANRISYLEDCIISALFKYATTHIYPLVNPTKSEELAVMAVGGYGRATLGPESDIDLLFILPYRATPWTEQVVEWILYQLWDLKQKVGHATRNIDECVRLSREDITIRTSILEARLICGSDTLAQSLAKRFDEDVVKNTSPEFIAAKLQERDERHKKSGDTAYLVEPNVKEGKGGLRDLHTLFWISKYHYRIHDDRELIKLGVLTRQEHKDLKKADDFLWAVRCHMHFITKRTDERLSFDIQPDIAKALDYQERAGLSAVERFMKHYFLVAKEVSDLTRIFCAALEAEQAKKSPRFGKVLGRFTKRVRNIAGTLDFIDDDGRILMASDDIFTNDPVNLIRLFHLADVHELDFHPNVLRKVKRSLKLINNELRHDTEANRLFLSILSSPRKPHSILLRMSEAGVLAKFIPEFGKIISMMQFNMYHHFTVDEHLIRSVKVLNQIEKGELADDHPLASDLLPKIEDRLALFVAVFFHDIAKGRPEDHSIAGAKVMRKLCPRLGMTPEQTNLVAWLIDEHLTMSMTAQTRDLNDRQTISDFAKSMQSLEQLRMLLILTVCDITAVGPGVWNGWKGQLLRTLYYETEIVLRGGFSEQPRSQRVAQARLALAEALENSGDDSAQFSKKAAKDYADLHYGPYLLTVDLNEQIRHASMIQAADKDGLPLSHIVRTHAFHEITEITVLAQDHHRLVSIIAGACAATGANIVDAQIFTTTDGRALNTIMINRAFQNDEDELRRAATIGRLIEGVLAGKDKLPEIIARKHKSRTRKKAFKLKPRVSIDNSLSDTFTIIEVECLDRTGILSIITQALADLSLDIGSAHICTFGEKVVDSFYVRDLLGDKIQTEAKQQRIVQHIKQVLRETELKPETAGKSQFPEPVRKPRKDYKSA